MDRAPINSYPDEVARKWKEERDRYRDALESMSFWTCTACEENMAIRDKALAHNSDACVLPLTHNGPCETARSKDECADCTLGRMETGAGFKCKACFNRDAATWRNQQDSAKVMQKTSEVNDRLHEMGLQSRREGAK